MSEKNTFFDPSSDKELEEATVIRRDLIKDALDAVACFNYAKVAELLRYTDYPNLPDTDAELIDEIKDYVTATVVDVLVRGTVLKDDYGIEGSFCLKIYYHNYKEKEWISIEFVPEAVGGL